MKEVWQLEGTELGKLLIPVLKYELVQRKGGSTDLENLPLSDDKDYEAIYGNENYQFLTWLDNIYKRASCIARISETGTGRNCGTGFLMKGSDLSADWGDEMVLLTNSHVMSDIASDTACIGIKDGMAHFTRIKDSEPVKIGTRLYHSPKHKLDCSIFKIKPPKDATFPVINPHGPVLKKNGDVQRVYVVGHPGGQDIAVSMYDNALVGYEKPYVHYRSPTAHGQSGSPVFNRQWQVFAIHHANKKNLQANEGIMLSAVIKDINTPKD